MFYNYLMRGEDTGEKPTIMDKYLLMFLLLCLTQCNTSLQGNGLQQGAENGRGFAWETLMTCSSFEWE